MEQCGGNNITRRRHEMRLIFNLGTFGPHGRNVDLFFKRIDACELLAINWGRAYNCLFFFQRRVPFKTKLSIEEGLGPKRLL